MKWGNVFFVKKSGKWGVFCKKVENLECFFVKSGPFLNAGCIMYSISIFILHFTYFGGVVRTQRTPLPSGLWWICRILLPPPAFLRGPIGLHIVQRPAMAVCLSGQMTKIDCFLCVWSARRFRCRRNPL